MRIAVPLESAAGEQRVALTPESAGRLARAGHHVRIQAGAGTRAGFPDSAYESVGAVIVDAASLFTDVELVCRVQPPTPRGGLSLPGFTPDTGLCGTGRDGIPGVYFPGSFWLVNWSNSTLYGCPLTFSTLRT